jgi:hypothetical protein
MLAQSPWALPALFLLSLPSTLAQSPQTHLSFDTPVTLTGGNFSTTSTPVVFSLPSSSQITISIALCAAASSSPPHVFVTNTSSDSQVVIPGPAGGPNVFEVTFNSLGLGNFTLDLPAGDATATVAGILAVYGGTTTDSLEIGVSQGGRSVLLLRLNKLHLIKLTFILVSQSSFVLFFLRPTIKSDRTAPCTRQGPTLLRRFNPESSTALLPALPRAPRVRVRVRSRTVVPELHPPTSEHDGPGSAVIDHAELYAFSCSAGRRTDDCAPADGVRHPRARQGRRERRAERAGPPGAAVAPGRERLASGVARRSAGAAHELQRLCDPGRHEAQRAHLLYYKIWCVPVPLRHPLFVCVCLR